MKDSKKSGEASGIPGFSKEWWKHAHRHHTFRYCGICMTSFTFRDTGRSPKNYMMFQEVNYPFPTEGVSAAGGKNEENK